MKPAKINVWNGVTGMERNSIVGTHIIGKTVALVLAICFIILCFTGCKKEDDFIIREGIIFGDTKATVMGKEKLEAAGSLDGYNTIIYFGEVAGYNDTEIVYLFDNNNQLVEVLYRIRTTAGDDIKDTLVRKYGPEGGSSIDDMLDDEKYAIRHGGVLYNMVNDEILSRRGMCSTSSWEKKCKGYTVLIRLVGEEIDEEYNIVYSFYTSEKQDRNRKQDQRFNDL